jgi:hypothetical protein
MRHLSVIRHVRGARRHRVRAVRTRHAL